MSAKPSPAPILTFTVVMAAVAVGAWWWRFSVARTKRVVVKSDPWEQVKVQYPLAGEPAAPAKLSTETFEALVQANPFSPKRRFVPPPAAEASGATGGEAKPVPPPQFVYKGRIDLGNRKRAIVVNLTTKKTHFLEVGQEVAGFKVLDITEKQVILSNIQTSEELVVELTSKTSAGSSTPQ